MTDFLVSDMAPVILSPCHTLLTACCSSATKDLTSASPLCAIRQTLKFLKSHFCLKTLN